MADEISLPANLKKALENAAWKNSGVCGLLTGRMWRGHTFVLNVLTSQDKTASNLVKDIANCQLILPPGTGAVGVIVIVKSANLSEAEKYIEALPMEVQTAIISPQFVVCTVQLATDQPMASFYQLSAEDRKLLPLSANTSREDFGKELVTFHLQAKIPVAMQLDNSKPSTTETWEEKINKVFGNLDLAVSSGGYTYGFQNTDLFLSEESVAGLKMNSTVQQLYTTIANKLDAPVRKKNTAVDQPPVMVSLYQRISGHTDRFAQPTCAPAVHQRTGSFRSLQMTLPLDVVVEVDAQEKVSQLQDLFSSAIRAQLQAMRCCLEQHHTKENEFYTPEPFHFSIPHRHTCVTVVYPRTVPDADLEQQRQQLHERMCLSLDQPLFRRANARLFPGQRAAGGYIINPHVGLPPSGVQGGTPHLVKGNYTYHHYMQDRFDDDKWGCAYRSLQTLVSWFRFQGYTDKAVPSHREIQQALVAVGDKEANFVGSKKWIGSFEVSFCLDHHLGVTSKFLNVSAGAELASKGRELAQHFDTVGTPIMIGGGVLAHTILGVDYSEMSGEIKFLILDPHYTGGEDLQTIQREGWCGWKGTNFWNQTAHYNMCMPTRPQCF